ncbi:MAG: hypothetical protein LAO05_04430 [Acidobacteriia bacterium]|nr:hypothetical protein [Terriglobia bacterium]
MSKTTMGKVMLVAGVLVFLVSATADSLGIGGAPGIGWKQIAGMLVGVAAAAAGAIQLRAPVR